MTDKIAGYLEVGTNDEGEIVVLHCDLETDADGVGHIVFSPNQARNLASLLLKHAKVVEDARTPPQPRILRKRT